LTAANQRRKTTDQRRAEHAWKAIDEILRKYPPRTALAKSSKATNFALA